MGNRLRSFSLAACLFVFLFVVVGASLRLRPMGAFLAALSGTFLVIHGVKRWGESRPRPARKAETPVGDREARLMVPEAEDMAEAWERLASGDGSQAMKARDLNPHTPVE
ncbi:MAG TPA: hypothetical protein VEK33_20220 [Terriglobales bacterium]|nr:hypothetical protein [Terriglobales bacterium]